MAKAKKPGSVLLMIAVVLVLSSCGGGSGSTSTSTAVPAATSRQKPISRSRRRVPVSPLKVTGGGSAQFRVKGGDNSVQEYGEEAGGPGLREAAEAIHAFYVARVRGEWTHACSLLASSARKSLKKYDSSSPSLKSKGCAVVLAAITRSVSPALARQVTAVDAASLRRQGKRAFLIYTSPPGRTAYAIPLDLEDGEWKVASPEPAPLS